MVMSPGSFVPPRIPLPPGPAPRRYALDLTDAEAYLLRQGVAQWDGPAQGSEALAVVLGFDDVVALRSQAPHLVDELERARVSFTLANWRRVLACAEVAFISDQLGAGRHWTVITGLPDAASVSTLRSVQEKFADLRRNVEIYSGHQHYEEPP